MLPTVGPLGIAALVGLSVQLTLFGTGCEDWKATGCGALVRLPVARSATRLARLASWLCQRRNATPPVASSTVSGTSDDFSCCSFALFGSISVCPRPVFRPVVALAAV